MYSYVKYCWITILVISAHFWLKKEQLLYVVLTLETYSTFNRRSTILEKQHTNKQRGSNLVCSFLKQKLYYVICIIICLVLYLPLWKIWVRQLGLWHSQYMEKIQNVPNHQPVMCHYGSLCIAMHRYVPLTMNHDVCLCMFMYIWLYMSMHICVYDFMSLCLYVCRWQIRKQCLYNYLCN
jgi:hypothetical protein